MRGINEQLLKTSGVVVLPSTKKLKKHREFQIEFLTQYTQQITSKGKQNKTKESVFKKNK